MDRTGLSNIVLIGMTASGKTTIGRKLARRVKYPFFDSDEEIMRMHGEIRDIFRRYGEDAFRRLETDILQQLSLQHNCIIATGGGAILNEDNIQQLRKNGLIVWLQRRPELVSTTKDRPVVNNKEVWMCLYQQRLPLYEKYCD
ncbi:MAG: shikimate kinase, partial [Erysipelotrichaceae bacterium]|nr:shikimate kinase [Erysipelotrichaceae bacterium]